MLLFFEKGLATHVKRVDSNWCWNSMLTSKFTMQWYVKRQSVAGFANTKLKRSDCNAKFVTVGHRVFIVSTKPIDADQEIYVYYKSNELTKRMKIKAAREKAAKKAAKLGTKGPYTKRAKGQPIRRR